MKILIPDPVSFSGGIETLNLALIGSLEKITERVVCVLPAHRIDYFKSQLPPSDRLVYEPFTFQDKSSHRYTQAIIRKIANSSKRLDDRLSNALSSFLDKQRLEFLIKKHGITHCLYTWISDQSFPQLSVGTAGVILDLNWHAFPENFPSQSLDQLDEKLMQWLQQASVLFAISKNVYDEVADFAPQFSSKVKVVPLAHENFVQSVQHEHGSLSSLLPFFLYPASALNHKNHYTLFKAVLNLAQKGLKFELVLTGGRTQELIDVLPSSSPEVERCRQFYAQNKDILSSYVRVLGRVDRAVVDSSYQTCRCVVIPTRYEGFGLPLVEALSWGAPVICSDIPSLREQVDLYHCHDCVQFFPAEDVEALTFYMARFITENSIARLSLQEARRRMQRWTWGDVAEKYVAELSRS